jgi:hypothetical protein
MERRAMRRSVANPVPSNIGAPVMKKKLGSDEQ